MNVRAVALATSVLLGSVSAFATPVTVVGSHISITYDSAFVGLFGAPTLSGDVVSWFPSGSPGFSATTGAGIAITNSTFALKVEALPGYTLSGLSLAESGDYFYFGSTAGVAVSGQLRVTPLPGTSTSTSAIVSTGFSGNTAFDFSTHDWTASANVTLAGAGSTLANVSVENLLAAYVDTGTGRAFIEKKEAFLTVAVSAVPEPETAVMWLAGLFTLAFLARRRRRG